MSASNSRAIALVALLTLTATGAQAKVGFGEKVDAYCSGLGRGTPFSDLAGKGFLSECALCHAFSYPTSLPDKKNTFDPPAAEYLAGKGTGNFSSFCPGVTNRLPTIVPIADRSLNVGEMLVIDVTASDPDGDPLALSVAGAPAGSSFVDAGNGTGTFTWTPAADDLGSHDLDFLAQDDAVPPGQALEAARITVGSSNRPPVLDPIGRQTGDPGIPLEIAVTASDADGDALSISAAPLPEGATFVDLGDGSGRFSWLPNAIQLGNHAVRFEVRDDGAPPASDVEAVTITIGEVNAPPVLAPVGNRRLKVGQPLSLALSAEDPDGDAVAFSASGLPAGAQLTDARDGSALVEWMPAEGDVGEYAVMLTVTDDGTPPESDGESILVAVDLESPPSDVRIDEAFWETTSNGGRLRVRGSGAHPGEMVGLLDGASRLVLGSRRANGHGGFRAKLEPAVAPCQIQVQAGDLRGAMVPVSDAPVGCDQQLLTSVRADWRCADPEEARVAGLRVRGRRAPALAAIEVRDGASDELLGMGEANARGRFKIWIPSPAPVGTVDVLLSVGELDWRLDAVPVRSRSCGEDTAE